MISIRLPSHHPDQSLFEARHKLRVALEERRVTECPCCGRHAQVYTRSLYAAIARALKKLLQHRKQGLDWVKIDGRNLAKAQHFGLVQHGNGMWTLTQKGVDFVEGRISVNRSVYEFDGRVVGRPEPGEIKTRRPTVVAFQDILANEFDLGEVLGESRIRVEEEAA